MSFVYFFILCLFFVQGNVNFSGVFFECVGSNVSPHLNTVSLTKKSAYKEPPDNKLESALVYVGGDVDLGVKIDFGSYAKTVLCPAKFGAGDYEVCSLPSLLCNKVYVRNGDQYLLMVEPFHPAAHKALAAAYVNDFTRYFRCFVSDRLTRIVSNIYGKYAERKGGQAIDAFLESFGFEPAGKTWKSSDEKTTQKLDLFGINPADWEKQRGEFVSFQDFFTRKLKRDARLVADQLNPRVIVAPADSKLTVIKDVDDELTLFNVKQADFNLDDFLKNEELAAKFRGGTMMIFRLSPYNYHRYHFGIDAVPGGGWFIKSKGLETVDPISYKTEIDPLIRNKRMFVPLETTFGNVGLVIVGAFNVGSINNTYVPGDSYNKAAELGYFAYGGSTLVYLFPKDMISVDKPFIEHSAEGFETAVKFGEQLAVFKV
jgi:phosphatidylserine decarboxylase